MKVNFSWWLVKIGRVGAWLLLATVVLFYLTSYGMEKGFVDRQIAGQLHLNILPALGVIAFIMHTGPAVRMALMRWKVWSPASKIVLIIVYVAMAAGFIFAAYFYKPQTTPPAANTTSQTPTVTSEQKTFTLAQLAQYDGKNGRPAYVAVDGVVYDLSSVFINGKHQGYFAGKDLSAAFYSRHEKQILSPYPVVGTLKP